MGFRLANIENRAALVADGFYYDLEKLSNGEVNSDPMLALNSLETLADLNARLVDATPTGEIKDVLPGPPVPRPRNCFAIGLNYRNHAEEAGLEIPEVPMVFTKHPSCLTGPVGNVEMRSDYVDYEAELVAVIGRGGKDIKAKDAWSHVAGLCVGQDISDRPAQFSANPPQFNLAKSFDTFGPIGPVLVSPDELEDPNSLEIECRVNDEVRQKDNTKDFIFDISSIIAYLSEFVTLKTGDVIYTGTPGGIGATQGKYLKDGDSLTTSIEGIGVMENKCVRISNHSRAEVIPDKLVLVLGPAAAGKTNK